MSAIILTREELYAEVWASPLTKLAKKYGLSDRGLGKVCARMEIPLPGVGYWAKAGAGHEVKQTPLPPLSTKGVASVELSVDLPAATLEIITPMDGEHPLVEQTRRALQGRKVSPQVPYLTNHEVSHLSVRVTPAYLERALGLMNTLLHALEERDTRLLL